MDFFIVPGTIFFPKNIFSFTPWILIPLKQDKMSYTWIVGYNYFNVSLCISYVYGPELVQINTRWRKEYFSAFSFMYLAYTIFLYIL